MMVTVDDRALLASVADGDRDALEALYRRHSGWLLRRLDSRCRDGEIADIALQDTFLAAWRSAPSYRGDGEVAAWLWGIAIRRLIDVLRTRRARPLDPQVLASTLADTERTAIAEDVTARTALGGLDGELDAALRHLPSELQSVLIATAIDGLTTREAARLLGVPHGTVKTRLMRARKQMQEALS